MKYSPTLYYIVTFWFSLGSFILFSAFHKTWDFAIARGGSVVSGTVGDRLWGYNRGVEAFTLLGKGIYPASSPSAKGVLANTMNEDALFEIFGEGVAAALIQKLPIRVSRYIRSGNLSVNDYEDRPANVPLDTIILHHTSLSKKIPAEQVASSWQGKPLAASGHFIISSRGEILLGIPLEKSAFHIRKQAAYIDPETGKLVNWINHRSIGIEFHYDPETEKPSMPQIVAGGRLLGALFELYPDLDVQRIFGHGIQSFSQPLLHRSKIASEPTHLLMEPDNRLSSNMVLLLRVASAVSPEIAREAIAIGGVEALAESIRSATLMNRQVTMGIDVSWSTESNLPVSPIHPALAIAEAEAIAERSFPILSDAQ